MAPAIGGHCVQTTEFVGRSLQLTNPRAEVEPYHCVLSEARVIMAPARGGEHEQVQQECLSYSRVKHCALSR